PRVGVLDVAEDDRIGRARLGARRHDRAICDIPPFEPGLVLGLTDPLHTEGALLHDALLPDRHVRVELPVQRLRPLVREPVEVPDLVRAVVRAVARADAPVVDLRVEPLRGVVRRVDRADRLARGVPALLTEHRQEPRALELAALVLLEVALDPHPGQDAALRDLLRADDPDVVLRIARGDARAAPDAALEIDRHPPPGLGLRVLAVIGPRR